MGVASLTLWFYAIGGGLPLATAMTLNYMSSVWMALFLIGGAVIMGGLGCAMILAGAAMNPMGFTAQNIPDAVMRVVDRFGG